MGGWVSGLMPVYLEIIVVNGSLRFISIRIMQFEFFPKWVRGKMVNFNISDSNKKITSRRHCV